MGPLSLSVIDIDNFKRINDRYGHLVGDRILVGVSNLIRQCIRKHDYLIRYGGEEFVILSNETDLVGAKLMCEKIRETVETYDFNLAEQITISIGVTELQSTDDQESFFSRADKLLFQAKKLGKNCVNHDETVDIV
jgi:diguanylate cyclase (GGDEF)-like protein